MSFSESPHLRTTIVVDFLFDDCDVYIFIRDGGRHI